MASWQLSTVDNINMHTKNILEEGELEEDSTIKNSLIVQNGRELLENPGKVSTEVAQKLGQRIDELVYRLYDLTEEEIALVEREIRRKNLKEVFK